MTRANKNEEDVWVRLAAEDRAFSYLVKNFTPQTTIAVAIRVEFFLAKRWEEIQEDLRRRADQNEWVEISICAMEEIEKLFGDTRPHQSNAAAERHLIGMFTKFAPDRAWWTARRLRRELVPWQKRRMERSNVAAKGEISEIVKTIRQTARPAADNKCEGFVAADERQ